MMLPRTTAAAALLVLLACAPTATSQPHDVDQKEAESLMHVGGQWWIGTDGDSVTVRLRANTAERESRTIRYASANRFFRDVREHLDPASFRIGSGDTLFVGFQNAVYADSSVYDAVGDYEGRLADAGDVAYAIDYAPLSLVGPVFSFEQTVADTSPRGPMGRTQTVQVVNLRSQRPTSLLTWVDTASVINALKQDPWVRQQASRESDSSYAQYASALDTASTIPGLAEVIGSQKGIQVKKMFAHFAFVGYDASSGTLAVRLVATRTQFGKDTNRIQLGLRVRPNDRLSPWIDEEPMQGFFLERFPNNLQE